MEMRMEPTFDKEKEKGRNVTIHAVFVRHGEKDPSPNTAETSLTLEGQLDSLAFGEKREQQKMIKSFSSRTDRTEDTGEGIVSGSPTENKGIMRNRRELEFVYDPDGLFYKEAMQIKAEIMGSKEEFEKLPHEEQRNKWKEIENKQADYYLSFGDKRPDPGTYSPVETAAKIASLIDHYRKMPDKINSGSELDLINATHDFNLVSFLSQVMVLEKDGGKKTGFNSVEEIGGATEFTEAFEIIINRDGEGKESIKFLFRGKEWEISENRLRELIEISKNMEL
jgi:hypothetical protein